MPTGKLTKRDKPTVRTVRAPGEVVRLLLDEDEVRYFDGRVSLITNLSRCRFDQKEEIRALVAKRSSTKAAEKMQ